MRLQAASLTRQHFLKLRLPLRYLAEPLVDPEQDLIAFFVRQLRAPGLKVTNSIAAPILATNPFAHHISFRHPSTGTEYPVPGTTVPRGSQVFNPDETDFSQKAPLFPERSNNHFVH
jgi:hypothetical protein